MKKIIAAIAAITTVVTAVPATAEFYATTAVITSTNDEFCATAVDAFGNEWFLVSDCYIGDLVAIIMDDMGTEEIEDDEVVDYWWAGCFDYLYENYEYSIGN